MIAYVRRLAIPAATLMALHCAPADAAHFVFTILTPPNQTGPAYVTGMYQDQAVGYTNGPDGQDYVSFVYSAGNYTILPAIPFFYGVTDSGLAFGYSANSEKAYSTYDLLSGATTTYNFAPPGNSTFAIGGMNAAGDVIAT